MVPLLSGLAAFFSWLMDYTIDISVLICLIFIIRSVTSKKLPAWWHYNLWVILLLRMIIPFKFNNHFNIPNVVPISIDESLFESILIEEDFIISKFSSGFSSNPEGFNIQVSDVLLFLWIAGTIIFGVYILVKNIRFRNIIKKEPLITEKKVLALLEECKHRVKTEVLLQITATDRIKCPALFGYIQPRLLLPAGAAEKLSSAELTYIFMHELGHLKRHDIGVSWIITFLHIFQWFNPLVWLAFYQMRVDQESACDAAVLSRINNNQTTDYACTIISFLENFCRSRKLPALVGILESQTQIKKRITMIINYRRGSKMMMFFSTASLVIIGFILFSFAGVAKQNKDNTVHDKLNVESKEVVIELHNDTIKNEITEVKFIADVKKVSVEAQGKVARDEIGLEEINGEIKKTLPKVKKYNINDEAGLARPANGTQKILSEGQDRGVKDKIANEKPGRDIQKVMNTAQDSNTKKEKEVMILASSGAFNESKDASNADSNNKDIQIHTPSTVFENRQIAQAAQLSENGRNSGAEDGMRYLGLASVAYLIPKKQDTPKETPALTENSHGDIEILNLKEVDEQPKIVSYYHPRYPFEAKARGIEGRVLLRFIVDKAGNVLNPQVVSAEPEGIFEQAALDTVTKYRLKPAIKDGKRVNTVVKLPINFILNDNYLRLAQR